MSGNTLSLKLVVLLALTIFGAQNALAQIKVTGRITDCEKKPMAGASIVIEKETKGTVSDKKGKYKITVQDTNAVLVYSFIGCETQKVKVGGKKKIDVRLKANKPIDRDNIIIRKPVIYLYPEVETEVSVRIDYSGQLLFTYPEYGTGWCVTASPDGILRNKADGREYSYLFWDGERRYTEEETTYESGFVVRRDATVAFLQDILSRYGLTPREYNEFIVYWTPFLSQNEWNFVHFRCGGDYDVISRNTVAPRPETSIRVFMDFKRVDGPFDVAPQQTFAPVRRGFTLVEWGGAELQQPIRVKTGDGSFREM